MSTSFYPGMSREFDDTAFEPHDAYMFDESSGMDHFRREVETSYDVNGGNSSGRPTKPASMAWGYVHCNPTVQPTTMTDLQAATRWA